MNNHIAISFFILFGIFSCTSDKQNFNAISDANDAAISNSKQTYHLSTNQDTTLILDGGIKVYIPVDAFVDHNNELVDSVRINFTECVTMESMFTQKLSTTSDSSLLISNGMLLIEVFNEDSECELANNKQLNISFPRNGLAEDYKYFYGEISSKDSSINWKLNPDDQIKKPLKPIVKKYIKELQYSGYAQKVDDFVPTYQFLDKNLKRNYFDYVIANFKPTTGAMNWLTDNHLYKSSSETDGLLITVYFNEDFTVRDIEHNASDTNFGEEINEFISRMPIINGESIYHKLPQPSLYFRLYVKEELDKKDYADQIEQRGLDSTTEKELEYYVFSISKLGWINCDIFYEDDDLVDMSIATPTEGLQYTLVFNSIKSILQPSASNQNLVFKNVPKGESVKLIGYKISEDSVLYTSKDFVTKKEISEKLKIENISYGEFKNNLAMLSK